MVIYYYSMSFDRLVSLYIYNDTTNQTGFIGDKISIFNHMPDLCGCTNICLANRESANF